MNRPILEKTMVGDFEKILVASPLLHEAYMGLPEAERKAVDDKYLEFVWQMILAGVDPAQAPSGHKDHSTWK